MRNTFKYNFILVFGILIFSITGCEDSALTDLNIDPNQPTEVPAVNLITNAQWNLADRIWSRDLNAEWTMLMVQHWAQNEYAEESRYTVDGNDFDFNWLAIFAGTGTSADGTLADLEVARRIVEADEGLNATTKANQLAIITILRVYALHCMVDTYGDIPYAQALDPDQYPLPEYDNQAAIYDGLLSEMEAAINSMDAGGESFGSGDIMYGGNTASWVKLANSLMMRMAMRIVDVDAAKASEYINKAKDNVLASNSDNGLLVFDANPALANPLYVDAVVNNRDDFCVTDVLVEQLTNLGDPRLLVYADTNNSGDIVGMPYGLTDGEAFALKPFSSRPHPSVRTAQAPAVFMDYAEVQFLTAEAQERGILPGTPEASYAEGITASMNYWGITDQAAIDAYIAANPYNAGNWKESIGVQKWIAFYMNGPQAWAEWRRLDYPQLEVPAAATNPVIPVRLPYPISEQTRNATNLGKVTSNPNDLSTKLWWDVN